MRNFFIRFSGKFVSIVKKKTSSLKVFGFSEIDSILLLWYIFRYFVENLLTISLSLRDFQILSDLPAGRLENMKIESTRIATRSVADGEDYSESNPTKYECFAAKV